MIMIIYIIFIGLHHYKYEPKLCILGSYVTQTILPGLWPRLVRLGWHIIHISATQPEVTDASPSLNQTNYSTPASKSISDNITSAVV